MVFHDDDLKRLAGRPERIESLPLGALREVTLRGGGGISTLDEVLEACGPDLLVNVELKAGLLFDGNIAPLVDRVSAIVDRAGAAARVLVSSFNVLAVRQWQRRRPDVKAALLFESTAPLPLRHAWALWWLRPFAAHPEDVMCDASAVARWKSAGLAVNTWTVDDPGRVRALRDMGIDGIVTNNPAAARAALGQ